MDQGVEWGESECPLGSVSSLETPRQPSLVLVWVSLGPQGSPHQNLGYKSGNKGVPLGSLAEPQRFY